MHYGQNINICSENYRKKLYKQFVLRRLLNMSALFLLRFKQISEFLLSFFSILSPNRFYS